MEELTKTQIVLLTLLVSFVTSIATGIVTVALVDQSSQGVGQTIQTVVQRTIETVIPSAAPDEEKGKTVSSIVTTSPTTIPAPSEAELIVQAVAKNSASLVRIKKANADPSEAFVALGVVVSAKGVLVTDHGLALSSFTKYVGVLSSGKEVPLTNIDIRATGTNVAIFRFTPPVGDNISVATLGDSNKLNLGQKVVSLSGADKDTVVTGIIANFDKNGTTTSKALLSTDFDTSTKSYGSILFNLAGEIVGMKTAVSSAAGFSFQAINVLKEEIRQGIISSQSSANS